MKVKAVDGIKVPMEGRPHQYIEQDAVDVEDSLYYQRRIADGDLIAVTDQQKTGKQNLKGASNEQ